MQNEISTNIKQHTSLKEEERYLAIGGAIFFNSPTSFSTESLQNLVVVTVLRQVVIPLSPKPGVNLRRDGSPTPLPPPVILPLPPRRLPPIRRRRSCSVRRHYGVRASHLIETREMRFFFFYFVLFWFCFSVLCSVLVLTFSSRGFRIELAEEIDESWFYGCYNMWSAWQNLRWTPIIITVDMVTCVVDSSRKRVWYERKHGEWDLPRGDLA